MYQPAFWDTGYVPWASYLSWRPLYLWGQDGKPVLNEDESLAEKPVMSQNAAGDTVVQITLKPLKWSDGSAITTRDVEFWMNLVKANKNQWAPYVPGGFPDIVKSVSYDSPTQFTLTLTGKYSQEWLLGNELDQITPIPQAAWDKTSATGKVGDYDRTSSGAVAVYKFLQSQAKKPATFGSNDLWQVADGPWLIDSYNVTTSLVTYKRNPHYSGPQAANGIKTFSTVPFTSDSAELNALESGSLDVGYVPLTSLNAIPALEKHGYKIADWTQDAFAGLIMQYAEQNKATPILSQLYVRQALTHLLDMKSIINNIWQGKAGYVSGPIPNPNGLGNDVTDQEKADPYPYSVDDAKQLLTSHGWSVQPNGTTTCTSPGTGASNCGAGISQGAQMSFTIVGTKSSPTEANLLQYIVSQFSEAGVKLNVKLVPDGNLASEAGNCAGKKTCDWDMELWMGEWPLGWTPYVEMGGNTFKCGAASNFANLCVKKNDDMIDTNHTSDNSDQAVEAWENYMSEQQYQIFLPVPVYRVVAYKSNMTGVTPLDPYLQIFPEQWQFSK
jgi:peptide/nickel transport system substrate-binding protein